MSNLARNFQEQQQQVEQSIQDFGLIKDTEKKYWLTPGEKVIGLVFAGLVCFGAVNIVSNQAQLYQVNKSVQDTETQVKQQQKINSDLQVQVSDLSNYQRILNKAKSMGLQINENNVRVVQGK